jgi:hypothetical protein
VDVNAISYVNPIFISLSLELLCNVRFEASSNDVTLVVLNVEQDQSLREEGIARDIVSRIQRMRKAARLVIEDEVEVFYQVTPNLNAPNAVDINQALAKQAAFILSLTKKPLLVLAHRPVGAVSIIKEEHTIEEATVTIDIVRPCFFFAPSVPEDVVVVVSALDFALTSKQAKDSNGKLNISVNGRTVQLTLGTDLLTTEQFEALVRKVGLSSQI